MATAHVRGLQPHLSTCGHLRCRPDSSTLTVTVTPATALGAAGRPVRGTVGGVVWRDGWLPAGTGDVVVASVEHRDTGRERAGRSG